MQNPDQTTTVGTKTFGRYPEMIQWGNYLAACAKMQMLPIKIETAEEKAAVGGMAANSAQVIFGK